MSVGRWMKSEVNVRLQGNEGIHRLTSQIIRSADDYTTMEVKSVGYQMEEGSLPAVSATPLCMMSADSISAVERRCPETLMTSAISGLRRQKEEEYTYRKHTVDTALDPDIAVLITSSAVSSVE